MRIAITAKGTQWESQVDPRFGRADYIMIYDEDADKLETLDNRDVANEAHGAGPRTAQKLAGLNAQVLITGNGPGGNAGTLLNSMNLKIYVGAGDMTLRQAYDGWKANTLREL